MDFGEFGNHDVPITLTGAQWIALLGRIVGRDLSPAGVREYREATEKLQAQLLAASDKCKEQRPQELS
jgi:hypothetical protein